MEISGHYGCVSHPSAELQLCANACSSPGRGRGWVGSWTAPFFSRTLCAHRDHAELELRAPGGRGAGAPASVSSSLVFGVDAHEVIRQERPQSPRSRIPPLLGERAGVRASVSCSLELAAATYSLNKYPIIFQSLLKTPAPLPRACEKMAG